MTTVSRALPDVFTTHEIARAAGCRAAQVRALVRTGTIASTDGEFFTVDQAARAVRALRGDGTTAAGQGPRLEGRPGLFEPRGEAPREARVPVIASTAVHGAMAGLLALLPLLPVARAVEARIEPSPPVRMVFLATPGPGGGGGGGGLRQPKPPARAAREGRRRVSSPAPPPAPPKPVEPPRVEPPPPPPEPEPVRAPVAEVPADPRTQAGVLQETPPSDARGPGTDGGAGTGAGTGLGEGQGPGVGEGSGGGTGGGPYRPGSGIEPPSLLREVKPDYTEEARRRRVEGDVVFEIVVRRDGSVGDIRLMKGLGHGLDERAAAALRQWRFAPARRFGSPVDVLVEVAVEFKLR